MEEKNRFKDLEQRLGVLETITKREIPTSQDNNTYFSILKNYIEFVDGEYSSLYTAETKHGFGIPATRKIHGDVNEFATNLVRYARTHKIIREVKEIFKDYAKQYGVDQTLSEMYFNVAKEDLKAMEKARHQYADSA